MKSFLKVDKYLKEELVASRLKWLVRKGNMIPANDGIRHTFGLQLRYTESAHKMKQNVAVRCMVSAKDVPPLTEKDLEPAERVILLVKVDKLMARKEVVHRDGREAGAFYIALVDVDFHVTDRAARISVKQGSNEVAEAYERIQSH